jgi:hypothetical protein
MNVEEIESEINYLNQVRTLQVLSIDFWTKKLTETNQKICNLEIDLLFENSKKNKPLKINK